MYGRREGARGRHQRWVGSSAKAKANTTAESSRADNDATVDGRLGAKGLPQKVVANGISHNHVITMSRQFR